MTQERQLSQQRKTWSPPKLEQLSVDLTAIAQKRKGNTDSRLVGAIS